MNVTNKTGLPQPVYDAIINDDYTKGDCDYSITGLLRPPRIAALERAHSAEIETDAADGIFSLFGKAIHTILERAEKTALSEVRLFATVDGKRISGKYDRYVLHDGVLQDYKITSIWKVMNGGTIKEFSPQQNMYVWLLRQNGFHVTSSQLVNILRDWSKSKARRSQDEYPVYQVVVQEIPIWPDSETYEFIRNRIRLHEEAKRELPLCSAEERWSTGVSWAIYKEGGKRAYRTYTVEADAILSMADLETNHPGQYHMVKRSGESKRCLDYCSVAKWCQQWKEIQACQQ